MMNTFLTALLFLASGPLFGRTESPLFVDWETKSKYLSDENSQLTLEKVQSLPESSWTSAPASGINFGFRKETFWFRMPLPECSSSGAQRVFEIAYPLLDRIDLWFTGTAGISPVYLAGDSFPYTQRPLDHMTFGFPYLCKNYQAVILRVQTTSSYQLPIQIWERGSFDKNELKIEGAQCLYFGAILVMALYNFFVYLSVRKITYLLYVLFALSFCTFQAGLSGMGFRYLWPNLPIINDYAIDKSINCIVFFAFSFTITFMQARIYSPRLNRIGIWLLAALIAYHAVSFALPYRIAIKFSIGFVVSAISLGFFVTANSIRRRHREGYFYGIAWTTFLIGAIVLAFNKLGILPRNPMTEHALQLSSVAEMLLLSFALADQMNILRNNLARSNRKLEKTLQSIEQIVDQKTKSIRSIMDTLKQGIITVATADLLVEPEYSHHTETLLREKNLGGRPFEDVFLKHLDIGSDQKSLIVSTLRACMGEDMDSFQLNSFHLPQEGRLFSGEATKEIVLDWTPVLNNDRQVERFLIAFHDVTELRSLRQEQASQSRMLLRLHQLLSADATTLRKFLAHAQRSIAALKELTLGEGPSATLFKKMFVDIHTMKGESRSLGLSELSEQCHVMEDHLDQVRKDKRDWDPQLAKRELESIEAILLEFSTVYTDHIGSLTESEVVSIRYSLLQAWEKQIRRFIPRQKSEIEAQTSLLEDLFRILHIDLGSYEKKMHTWARRIARELGKPEPQVTVRGAGIFLSHTLVEHFDHAFVHILQNAMVHGIEGAAEREAQGKSAAGHIQIELVHRAGQVHVIAEDDGRGIDLRAIRQRAEKFGILKPHEDLTESRLAACLLHSGFSSTDQVTSHAGRGVGLEAVRRFVEELSGQLRLDFKPSREGFMRFAIVMIFPDQLFPTSDFIHPQPAVANLGRAQ